MLKAFIKDTSFGISVLLIALAVGVAVMTLPIFGNKALIVKSGSMNPTVKVGDLVVVKSQPGFAMPQNIVVGKYKVGEVVAFKNQLDPKIVTTHRIVGTETRDGKVYYHTRGDANNSSDKNVVLEENVIGRADHSVRGIGKLFAFAKSKTGLLLLIIFPALMVIVIEFVNLLKELKKNVNFPGQIQFSGSGAIKVVLPLLVVGLMVSSTFAYFSKSAISTSNIFTASIPSPSPTPQVNPCPTTTGASVVINEINWGGSNGDGNDEWVELCNTTGSEIDLSNWVVENLGTGSGGGANLTIPSGKTIPANGFFIISALDKANSKINVDSDLVISSLSLNNGGEQLKLKTSTAVLVDTANGTGAWLAGSNSTPKKSMERKSPVGDGTVGTNWQSATTHTNMDGSGSTDEFGTPKAANGI